MSAKLMNSFNLSNFQLNTLKFILFIPCAFTLVHILLLYARRYSIIGDQQYGVEILSLGFCIITPTLLDIWKSMSIYRNNSSLLFLIGFILISLLFCIRFLYLDAFLGLVSSIIYLGAIAILMVFMVMMLNFKRHFDSKFDATQLNVLLNFFFSCSILGICFFLSIENSMVLTSTSFYILNSFIPEFTLNFLEENRLLSSIGDSLYSLETIQFFIVGFLLLVAMVGAIYLGRNDSSFIRIQKMFSQHSRSSSNSFYSQRNLDENTVVKNDIFGFILLLYQFIEPYLFQFLDYIGIHFAEFLKANQEEVLKVYEFMNTYFKDRYSILDSSWNFFEYLKMIIESPFIILGLWIDLFCIFALEREPICIKLLGSSSAQGFIDLFFTIIAFKVAKYLLSLPFRFVRWFFPKPKSNNSKENLSSNS